MMGHQSWHCNDIAWIPACTIVNLPISCTTEIIEVIAAVKVVPNKRLTFIALPPRPRPLPPLG